MLISVTGGAKSLALDSKLESAVTRGLPGAVRTTGAWTVTGGTNCGCMRLVAAAGGKEAS